MRVGTVAAITGLVGLGVLGAAGAPAGAVTPARTAWWNEAPLGLVLAATPPQPDELLVAEGAGRPDAVAAVDYSVAGTPGAGHDALGVSATLTVSLDTSSSVGTPAVLACPVVPSDAGWPAGGDQRGAPPSSDCSSGRAVAGQVSSDGASVTFPLTPAQQLAGHPGVFNLVLAPASQTPFQAVFRPPGNASFTVNPPPQPGPAAPASSAGAPASGGAGAPPGTPAGGAPGPGGAAPMGAPPPSLASGDLGSVTALPAPAAVGPGAASAPAGPVPGAPARPSPSAAASRPPAAPGRPGGLFGGRRGQLVGVWILVDVGVVLFLFGSDLERAPRLLGSVAARRAGPVPAAPAALEGQAEVRGIGRFARPRTAPPRRLY